MAPKTKTYGSAGEMVSAGYAGGRGSQDPPPPPVSLEASSGGAMTDAPKRRLVSQTAYERPAYCEGFQIVAQEGPRLVIPDGHSGSSEIMDGERLVTTFQPQSFTAPEVKGKFLRKMLTCECMWCVCATTRYPEDTHTKQRPPTKPSRTTQTYAKRKLWKLHSQIQSNYEI